MLKQMYLNQIEEAYKQVGRATTTIGLYLTAPFAGSEEGEQLADQARRQALDLEKTLREMYRVENAVDRP